MNELLNINLDTRTVSARDLHEQLNIGTQFTHWFERMCEYGFTEGVEFWSKKAKTPETGGRPATDYEISIDMAKEICMIQRTPEGKKVRQYLIDLEKAWNTPEQVMARALRLADETIKSLTVDIERMKPKEEFFDAVTDSKDAIPMANVAKVLGIQGIGRNNLFKILRAEKILQSNSIPYQEYIDRGYFRVVEQKYDKPYGEVGINIKTLVFQKGIDFIQKLLVKRGYA